MTIACMTDCWLMPIQNGAVEDMVREDASFARWCGITAR